MLKVTNPDFGKNSDIAKVLLAFKSRFPINVNPTKRERIDRREAVFERAMQLVDRELKDKNAILSANRGIKGPNFQKSRIEYESKSGAQTPTLGQ